MLFLKMKKIEDPLKTVLIKYCNVESYDPIFLRIAASTGVGFPYDVGLLKFQLKDAIDKNQISTHEYEEFTGEVFNTEQDLRVWLQELLAIISVSASP